MGLNARKQTHVGETVYLEPSSSVTVEKELRFPMNCKYIGNRLTSHADVNIVVDYLVLT